MIINQHLNVYDGKVKTETTATIMKENEKGKRIISFETLTKIKSSSFALFLTVVGEILWWLINYELILISCKQHA